MEITKIHPVTGKSNTLDININASAIFQWTYLKKPIQQVAPHLSADEREFLISGLLPGEFDKLFPDVDRDKPTFVDSKFKPENLDF